MSFFKKYFLILNSLFFSSSQLKGNIPSEFGLLSNLEQLSLGSNQLISLPSEFGEMKKLTSLTLSDNPLNSTIPNDFDQLTSLEVFSAHNCQLFGTIPSLMWNNLKFLSWIFLV